MIAKSDLVILVVSASLLAVGIFRWQSNLSAMSANAQQVQAQQVAPADNTTAISSISNSSNTTQTTISSVASVQTTAPVDVSEPTVTSTVTSNSSTTALQNTTLDSTNITQDSGPLFGSYTVVSGDYLSKIAQQFGTSVSTLQEINNINGTLIEVGQVIQFPLPAN